MFGNDPGVTGAPGAKPKPPKQGPAPASPGGGSGPPGGGYTPPAPADPGSGGDPWIDPPSHGTPTTTPTFPGIPGVLGSDPNYQQLLAFDTAASGDDLATMNHQIARMQGYYGNDNDPLSILGRVYQAYQDQNRYIANTLAGHGMIDSGETKWQGDRATLNYQRQELDARMKLQDYIDGLQQAFAQAQRQQKFNEMQAQWNAVQNWINNNPPNPGTPDNPGTPNPDYTPPTPPTLGTGGTQVVYDENGKPIVVGSSETYNPFK